MINHINITQPQKYSVFSQYNIRYDVLTVVLHIHNNSQTNGWPIWIIILECAQRMIAKWCHKEWGYCIGDERQVGEHVDDQLAGQGGWYRCLLEEGLYFGAQYEMVADIEVQATVYGYYGQHDVQPERVRAGNRNQSTAFH